MTERISVSVDIDGTTHPAGTAAPAFGLGRDAATQILSEVSRGVADWAAVARSHGVRASEVALMAYAFGESEQHAG